MMRFSKLSRKNRGFTLIELIMTIVVVGIVALPISLTLGKQVQSVFVSRDYTMALHLARFKMETIFNTAYASITSATDSSYQGYTYNVTTTVSYAFGTSLTAESVKLVTVSVTKTGSATVLVTLNNYIVKNVTWGL